MLGNFLQPTTTHFASSPVKLLFFAVAMTWKLELQIQLLTALELMIQTHECDHCPTEMTATWPLEYLGFTDYGFPFTKNSFQSQLGFGPMWREGGFFVFTYTASNQCWVGTWIMLGIDRILCPVYRYINCWVPNKLSTHTNPPF